MGSIPFLLSGSITNPVDALFETVSGFTTTGASILPAVEPLQHGILFWRSFTLDRRYGSSRVPSLPASAYRKRLSYEPHESREPGPLCHKAGPKGAVHRKRSSMDSHLFLTVCWSLFSCLWDRCRCLIPCVPFSAPREPEVSVSRMTASEAIPPTCRA